MTDNTSVSAKAPAVLRQSNIELLRIIAMVLIVAHHFSFHGGFDFPTETVTFNRLWVQFLLIGGKIGVNIFVLISGYFMISSTAKISKIIKLWLQIITYSVLFFAVFTAVGVVPFSFKAVLKALFPITFSNWWFASTYFVMYLLSPYINKLLHNLSKKSYQRLLILLAVLWSVIPTFLTVPMQSNSLLWFIFIYALAGYIRLYIPLRTVGGGKYIASSAALMLLTFSSVVVFDILGTKYSVFAYHSTYLYAMQRIPAFLTALLMFIGFLKTDIGCKKAVNIISSATFGVYLIHENQYVAAFFWKKLFANASYSNRAILLPYSIAAIVIVYTVCTAIELVRIYGLEKHYTKAINKVSVKIEQLKEKFFSLKIFEKF